MGNIITNDSGYIKQSQLANLINEWAKNDYDAGLGYNKDSSSQIKHLLKKRACCVRKNYMPIALPKINITDLINPLGDDYGYETVNIAIFADTNDMTQNCRIDNSNYLLPATFNSEYISTEGSCTLLYEGNSRNEGLCKNIKNERLKQTDSEFKASYSIYHDKQLENVYSDCNCLNSVFRKKKDLFKESYSVDENIIAQKFDRMCSSLGDNVYKAKNFETNMCINIVDVNSMKSEDLSIINLNQNCSQQNPIATTNSMPSYAIPSTNPSNTTKPTNPTTAINPTNRTNPTTATTATNPVKPANNYIIYISILIIIVGILIFFFRSRVK
jgi:hypothetical protein